MPTELERAEQNVETRSESLKKPLGLFDLVLTQILFVVGSTWVGAAAKLGRAHLFFWLLAILLFYIPQAAVVIYLNRRMPLEGGIYQWAKLGFNAFAMLLVYGALICLPLLGLVRGELKSYQPLQLALPTMSIFYCFNIFSKLSVGALSGFEYVAILAGETRSPARDIGRSVLIASPVIALAFILGTSSVLAFVGNNPIDLIGPVPQTLRLGLRSFPIAGAIASAGIILMTVRTISSTSVHFTGTSRLPMVAGWDHLLPVWFTRLHPKYKTPINSVVFVGIITLVIAISSQIGAGIQEAFQLVDNAANVFYGVVYLLLFAIPIFGTASVRSGAPVWLRVASACGCVVSLLAIFFTVYPIIDVPNPLIFGTKIAAVAIIANAIGAAIFAGARRKRPA